MKILIRIIGLLIISLIIIFCGIYLINTNIIANELNDCSALAIKQTQNIMQEIVKKRLDREEVNLFADKGYSDFFVESFNDLVLDSSLYDIRVDSDYNKGIIFVEIDVPKYKLIPKKKLVNIINVEGEGLDDIESHYYEEVSEKVKEKFNSTRLSGLYATTLYTWEFDKPTKVLGYDLEIFAVEYKTYKDETIIGPEIELRCYNEDDEMTLMDKKEGGRFNKTILESDECYECKLVELVMTKDVVVKDYSYKTDTVVTNRNSCIYVEKVSMKEKEDYYLSEECKIYQRYIDDIKRLNEKSIWLQDKNYESVLIDFTGKLK